MLLKLLLFTQIRFSPKNQKHTASLGPKQKLLVKGLLKTPHGSFTTSNQMMVTWGWRRLDWGGYRGGHHGSCNRNKQFRYCQWQYGTSFVQTWLVHWTNQQPAGHLLQCVAKKCGLVSSAHPFPHQCPHHHFHLLLPFETPFLCLLVGTCIAQSFVLTLHPHSAQSTSVWSVCMCSTFSQCSSWCLCRKSFTLSGLSFAYFFQWASTK